MAQRTGTYGFGAVKDTDLELLASTTISTTGSTTAIKAPKGLYWIYLNISAMSGSPTLDMRVETDDVLAMNNIKKTVGTFAQISTAAGAMSPIGVVSDGYLRLDYTIGSTTSFTVDCYAVPAKM